MDGIDGQDGSLSELARDMAWIARETAALAEFRDTAITGLRRSVSALRAEAMDNMSAMMALDDIERRLDALDGRRRRWHWP